MKMHPRVKICSEAKLDLEKRIHEWVFGHDLTWAETFRCLLSVVNSYMKYPVRQERHGDASDKGADEA